MRIKVFVFAAAALTLLAFPAFAQSADTQQSLQMAEMEKQCAQLSARVKALQDYYATLVQTVNELNKALTKERQKNDQLGKRLSELEDEVVRVNDVIENNMRQTDEAMNKLVDKVAKETAGAINTAMKSAVGAPAPGGNFDEYKVQPGATLNTIAKAYGVTVEAIQKANNLKGDSIRDGQILKIPRKSGSKKN